MWNGTDTSNVAGCLDEQVSVSDVPEYVAGTFVWSESWSKESHHLPWLLR